jgi:photosystem II stability/assembly factor-like uncharacterized protein
LAWQTPKSPPAPPLPVDAPLKLELPANFVKSMPWRQIGPTSMGGRIVDLAVVETDPTVFWIATASGGLFKTTNNGVTFAAQFQYASSISIGDICVAPSNSNILWVGTGENNPRNSVSWGDGVYKSTDGGKTFKHMGLKKSFQSGRIVIHPTNPDIVYVSAMGRLWGPNEERGLYKTIDGGKTWQKSLSIDDKTGCIELVMHPRDSNTLLAAMYERQRDAFDGGDPAKRFAPGSGLYKTTDAGKTWKQITKGLPTGKLGRIGLDYYKSNPDIIFAVVESEKIGTAPKGARIPALMGIQGSANAATARLNTVSPNGPSAKAGLKAGDVITEMAGQPIKTYRDLVAQIQKHAAGETISVKAKRSEKTIEVKLIFGRRGGQGSRGFAGPLGGQIANAQGRQGTNGFQTGGVYKSIDGGESWNRINSLNPRPFYFSQIRVDPSDEKIIYVHGIQLFRSTDGGKTFRPDAGSKTHPDHHAMWIDPRDGRHIILGCDGGLNITYDRAKTWDFIDHLPIGQFYHVGVDTRSPYRVYGGLQDNGSWGGPSALRGNIGPSFDDWFVIGGGDGFICHVDPHDPDTVYFESQYGNVGRLNLKTGARARFRVPRVKNEKLRFNWKTPFILSAHNPRIFYMAGNKVYKSLDQGNDLRTISPDLTTHARGTTTALAESPMNPNVLYAGTDDGHLWITTDGGTHWTECKLSSIPGPRRVNSIEASRFVQGRAYVVYDGHYYNDDTPYVFVTEDFGKTWTSLRANLPDGTTRVLREDVVNRNLLYLGAEFGLWASIDRGQSWSRLNNNLPHVAVHEVAVHPTAGEIVAGTHGRSLWILDVTPLRQLTKETLAAGTHFFRPKTATLWQGATGKRFFGHRQFFGDNPTAGAVFQYRLAKQPKRVMLSVTDIAGTELARIQGSRNIGLNRAVWNLRRRRIRGQRPPQITSRFSLRIDPGTYLVTLDVDGEKSKQTVTIAPDPKFPARTLTFDEEEQLRKQAKVREN